jgi:hypothetical protein
MASQNTRWLIIVSWVAAVLVAFWATGASSGFSLMLLGVAVIGPPLVMLSLWTEGPPQTIAEVLYDAERRR